MTSFHRDRRKIDPSRDDRLTAPMQAPEPLITLFGLPCAAQRCRAQSKRSGVQCRKAAMKDKRVCRAHGGASTGPRTAEGRARCAEAKTVHGWETRATRRVRDAKFRELRALERLMKLLGMIR